MTATEREGDAVDLVPDYAADAVTVTFTRGQADALFGLLRQASERSYGLLIEPAVRDAWVQLSAAYAAAADSGSAGYSRPLLLGPVCLGKGADGAEIWVCPCCSRQIATA